MIMVPRKWREKGGAGMLSRLFSLLIFLFVLGCCFAMKDQAGNAAHYLREDFRIRMGSVQHDLLVQGRRVLEDCHAT